MIEENTLRQLVNEKKTIWQVMDVLQCSRNTICSWMKQHNIKSPKGFFATGKKAGRPKGFKHNEEWKVMMHDKFVGEGNPFHGQKHSKNTKKKMSNNHADFTGDKNPFKKACEQNPDLREQLKERTKKRWASYSPDQRDKIRTKFSVAQCNNTYHQTHSSFKSHKHGFHYSSKCSKFFYRSSWELMMAKFLDDSLIVLSYKGEPFMVKYADAEGIERGTRPDFLATLTNDNQVLIEVKPRALMNYRNNREKIIGMQDYAFEHNIKFVLADDDFFKGITPLSDNLLL